VNHNGTIYYWAGTYYMPLPESTVRAFLKSAAIRCGVPHDISRLVKFVKGLEEQFLIDTESRGQIQEPAGTYINLNNGTLFFSNTGHRFEAHSPLLFIRYVLKFDYNPDATAPLWQQHLDRSLPNKEMQEYLAKGLALPFYQGKIEKALILYGIQDTGKSLTTDVSEGFYGVENISTELLVNLTKSKTQGDYSRASLDGKLVNIGKDVSSKISDVGVAKNLFSREAITARYLYKNPFSMRNYARFIFAMNDLPLQFLIDPTLTKRIALIEFDQQIALEDKDIHFAERIIDNELSGVLNWVIGGLKLLNATGHLNPPPCCVEAMDRIRQENDPLSIWLVYKRYCQGRSEKITLDEAYSDFVWFCKESNNNPPQRSKFKKQLTGMGYDVKRPNHHAGTPEYFYFSWSEPSVKNYALPAPDAPSLKTQGETEAEAGHESGVKATAESESPRDIV
jgi:putative DNA primase/helicase